MAEEPTKLNSSETDLIRLPSIAPEAGEDGPILGRGRRRSVTVMLGDFLQAVGVWLAQDTMPRMAAALSYRTIFSLIPFLVLSFLIFRLFPNSKEIIDNFLNEALARSGFSALSSGKESVGEAIKNLTKGFQGVNFGAIGVVSAAVLIYGALSLLVDIESSFNAMFGATRARSWAKRITQYWFIISIGPLFVYAGFEVGNRFDAWAQNSVRQVSAMVEQVQEKAGLSAGTTHGPGDTGPPWRAVVEPGPEAGPAATTTTEPSPTGGEASTKATGEKPGSEKPSSEKPVGEKAVPQANPSNNDGAVTAFAIRLTGYVVTVAISALLLLVLYVTVPNTVVRIVPALAGAFTGGLLLEVAKAAFKAFFSAKSYENLYGGLALLPLFLMWVYITWFIVLFGLRVAFLVQHGRTGVLLQAFKAVTQTGIGGSWMEPARAVQVVVSIAESFAQGKSARPSKLAQEAGMDEPTTRLLLSRLEEDGVLNRVATEGREHTYTLSRPADAIQVAEIVAIGQSLAGPVAPGATGDLIAKVRSAQLQAVVGVSLASLLTKSRPARVSVSPLAPAAPPLLTAGPAVGGGNGVTSTEPGTAQPNATA